MLYDLVTLKTELIKRLDPTGVVEQLVKLRNDIVNIKNVSITLNEEQIAYVDRLVAYYDDLIAQAQVPLEDNKLYLTQMSAQINEVTHRLFYNNYSIEKIPEDINTVRQHRFIKIGKTEIDEVVQRITVRTNWKYPVLEIGCRDGEWTKHLVAADPLYIMDPYPEFLKTASGQFPIEYQNRLRKYNLKDFDDLTALPQKQFAFVFSWGYFNFVSIDTMTQYLKQIHSLLRPGGTFLFSYNDGDTPRGAAMSEGFFQTYMPKSILIPLCESLGFLIIEQSKSSFYIDWIEIGIPGELSTNKAHQVFGKILPKRSAL